ncbi:MAG: hypothetical protein R6U00_12895, partial [Prochlorococcaceae cyanobacterium]
LNKQFNSFLRGTVGVFKQPILKTDLLIKIALGILGLADSIRINNNLLTGFQYNTGFSFGFGFGLGGSGNGGGNGGGGGGGGQERELRPAR